MISKVEILFQDEFGQQSISYNSKIIIDYFQACPLFFARRPA